MGYLFVAIIVGAAVALFMMRKNSSAAGGPARAAVPVTAAKPGGGLAAAAPASKGPAKPTPKVAAGWMQDFTLEPESARGGWLVVTKGEDTGKTFRLGERALTIGRAPSNLIQITDGDVSRNHCGVKWTPSGYEVSDMTSAHGTKVNGNVVDKLMLKNGDELQLGATVLKFEADASHPVDHTLGRKEIGQKTEVATEYVFLDKPAGSNTSLPKRFAELGRLGKVKGESPRPDFLEEAAKAIVEHLDVDRILFVQAKDAASFRTEHTHRRAEVLAGAESVAVDRAVMRKATESKKGGATRSPEPDAPEREGPTDALAAPGVQNDRVHGIVYIDRVRNRGGAFDAYDLAFVEEVARLAYGS